MKKKLKLSSKEFEIRNKTTLFFFENYHDIRHCMRVSVALILKTAANDDNNND